MAKICQTSSIAYIDRDTKQRCLEQVYGAAYLEFLYGQGYLSHFFGRLSAKALARTPLFSALFGWWQTRKESRRKIAPFIKEYGINVSEFKKEVADFQSFNDFFIRQLKTSVRPIADGPDLAIMPADGRYLFHPDIEKAEGFVVKGRKFCLATFLQSEKLAKIYRQGTMIMARLCPSDYHRFHFPCDGIPSDSELINGWLYSVNPIAIKQNIDIFSQNKRALTTISTKAFGDVLYIEIGATNVGSIIQTYTPHISCRKGDEKGYFSFGASSLVLLFPPNRLQIAPDLLELSKSGLEIRCLMGQSLGKALHRG